MNEMEIVLLNITDEWNASRLSAEQDDELEGLDELSMEQLEQFKVFISIAGKKISWLQKISPKLHKHFDIDESLFSGLLEREERRTKKSFGELKRTRYGAVSPPRSIYSSSQSADDGGYHLDLPRSQQRPSGESSSSSGGRNGGRGGPRIGAGAGVGAGANDDEES